MFEKCEKIYFFRLGWVDIILRRPWHEMRKGCLRHPVRPRARQAPGKSKNSLHICRHWDLATWCQISLHIYRAYRHWDLATYVNRDPFSVDFLMNDLWLLLSLYLAYSLALLQVVKKSLMTFVNKHLNKLNLEVTDLDAQFSDGVYLCLLVGLLEGYFVPLHEFHLTPQVIFIGTVKNFT